MKSRLPELIDPFCESRIVNCSYEVGMGAEAYVTGGQSRTKQMLCDQEQLSIPPGQFAHLLTEEIIEMPNDALGLISMKSRLKSRGLVNVSGFHIDPGYRGRLLLSVYNAGPRNIVLTRGNPTFLIWYAFLDSPTEDVYSGDRAGLEVISGEDVMRLHGELSTPQALAVRVDAIEKRLSIRRDIVMIMVGALITAGVAAATGLLGYILNLF